MAFVTVEQRRAITEDSPTPVFRRRYPGSTRVMPTLRIRWCMRRMLRLPTHISIPRCLPRPLRSNYPGTVPARRRTKDADWGRRRCPLREIPR